MSLQENYTKLIEENIKKVQETGIVPEDFVYSFNGKTWLLVIPTGALKQKYLVSLLTEYTRSQTAESEDALIKGIMPYCKVNGELVDVNTINLRELEVLKTAYMDGLLLPLYQGEAQAVEKFMSDAIKNLS